MDLHATVAKSATARYRRVLRLGVQDLTLRRAADPGADLPVPLSSVQIDRMVNAFAAMQQRKTATAKSHVRKTAGPEAVGPRDADSARYERNLRRLLLNHLLAEIRSGLSTAVAAAEAIDRLDQVTAVSDRRWNLVDEEVEAQATRVAGHHRKDLIDSFQSAVGVDISPVLEDADIRPLMDRWRRQNVSLIRTIPQRLHDGLTQRISTTFVDKPFDQQALRQVIAEEGKSSGWNLRRIARDQTNKAVGQLTRARHQQIGVTQYIWRAVQDERVRPEHAALDGTPQSWADPVPGAGYPGDAILCRCKAQPIIEGLEYPELEADDPTDQLPAVGDEDFPDTLARRIHESTDPDAEFSAYRTSLGPMVNEDRTAYLDWDLYQAPFPEAIFYMDDPGYEDLTRKQRSGEQLTPYEQGVVDAFVKHARPLDKDRRLFRGLHMNRETAIARGGIVPIDQLTSMALDPSVASAFTGRLAYEDPPPHEVRTLFEITNTKGLRGVAFNEYETEWTAIPGPDLEVLDVRQVKIPTFGTSRIRDVRLVTARVKDSDG